MVKTKRTSNVRFTAREDALYKALRQISTSKTVRRSHSVCLPILMLSKIRGDIMQYKAANVQQQSQQQTGAGAGAVVSTVNGNFTREQFERLLQVEDECVDRGCSWTQKELRLLYGRLFYVPLASFCFCDVVCVCVCVCVCLVFSMAWQGDGGSTYSG